MGRSENMDMERSQREFEYEKKFGKDNTADRLNDWNAKHHTDMQRRANENDAAKEHEMPYWKKD